MYTNCGQNKSRNGKCMINGVLIKVTTKTIFKNRKYLDRHSTKKNIQTVNKHIKWLKLSPHLGNANKITMTSPSQLLNWKRKCHWGFCKAVSTFKHGRCQLELASWKSFPVPTKAQIISYLFSSLRCNLEKRVHTSTKRMFIKANLDKVKKKKIKQSMHPSTG